MTRRQELLVSFYKETEVQKGFRGSLRPRVLVPSGSRLDLHWTTLQSVNDASSVQKIKEKALIL